MSQPDRPLTAKGLCEQCGPVGTTVAHLHIEVRSWVDDSTCRFTCPICDRTLRRVVPPPIVTLLTQAGARLEYPEGAPPIPPPLFTANDVAEFRRQLDALPTAVRGDHPQAGPPSATGPGPSREPATGSGERTRPGRLTRLARRLRLRRG